MPMPYVILSLAITHHPCGWQFSGRLRYVYVYLYWIACVRLQYS
jgi:hypothetical protein